MARHDAMRRVAALENQHAAASTVHDGYAPEAWTRLAPWALLVHDAGVWDAAVAAARAGTLPDESNPYGRSSGGPLWDITLYWQRGTLRYLNREREQLALWVIAACVTQLLEQGMSRAEIRDWRTGRRIWDEVWSACAGEETADETA